MADKPRIKIHSGFAIDCKGIDAVVNSANNGLLLGTSGAKRVREATGYLPAGSTEETEFYQLCRTTGAIGTSCLRWLDKENEENRKEGKSLTGPSYVQLECLKAIKSRNGKPVNLGDAVMTSSGLLASTPGMPKSIIHAVAMGYEWKKNTKGKRILATNESLRNALEESLALVRNYGFSSIALPLMCVRKDYGLNPKDCLDITLNAIKQADAQNLEQVILCADNSVSRDYLRTARGL